MFRRNLTLPAIFKVKLFRIGSESLFEHTWVVALLKHVEVNSSLVFEADPLRVSVSIKRIHEYQRHIASILVVHVLLVRDGK